MTGPALRPRPTTYKGIAMRSRLEAGYAAWLDSCGFDWEYEPRAFASDQGQYLPDFLVKTLPQITTGGERDAYIEVKPQSWDGDSKALARRMLIVRASFPPLGPQPLLILEQQGRPPRQLIHDPSRWDFGPFWAECQWVIRYVVDSGPRVALAWWASGPWARAYWKGPA